VQPCRQLLQALSGRWPDGGGRQRSGALHLCIGRDHQQGDHEQYGEAAGEFVEGALRFHGAVLSGISKPGILARTAGGRWRATKAAHQKCAVPWFMWGLIVLFQVYILGMHRMKRSFTAKSILFVASTTLIRHAQPNNNPTLVFVHKLMSDGGRRSEDLVDEIDDGRQCPQEVIAARRETDHRRLRSI
jgi:hypothetical protein